MSQKDKEVNTLNKLKSFFFREKSAGGTPREQKIDTNLLREWEGLLQPHLPAPQRCRTLKELCESDRINRLEDAAIQKLWNLTKDLIEPSRPSEQRHIAFKFYRKLIQSQYEDLSLMREYFFSVIQNHNVPEDISHRLDLLKTLTDNGKNIKNVDDTIGEFTLNWMPAIVEANLTQSFLEVIVNIIQFNAAHLDEKILVGYITQACRLCCTHDDTQTVLQCLYVLETALCYAVFPTETLFGCIVALCRTVNKETYVQTSWKIMKKLLGTNLGHAALLNMCGILNAWQKSDEALLRGAVFHINMGLWGSTGPVVPMLRCSPSAILMCFLRALQCQRIIVTYEVIIGIQKLIDLSGKELSEPSWDVLCDILIEIYKNIKHYEKTNVLAQDSDIQTKFHKTLTEIEELLQRNEAATDFDRIYNVIEHVCEDRPEQSIIQLIEYKAMKISPTQRAWLNTLNDFMNLFFNMRNINIRNQSIQVMCRVMQTNRAAYEEEILERIVIPLFAEIHHEPEATVRTSVGRMLLDFITHCDTKRSLELLDIIEKLFNRSFEKFTEEGKIILKNDNEMIHITTMADELIRVFVWKLYHLPASHAIKIFQILIGHLEKYYTKTVLMDPSVAMRRKIFAWMLKMRANATYNIGYPDEKAAVASNNNQSIRFSHYLSIELSDVNYRVVNQATTIMGPVQTQQTSATPQQQQQQQQQQQPLPQPGGGGAGSSGSVTGAGTSQPSVSESHATQSLETLSTIPIRRSCKLIMDCLKLETDWSTVQLVLKELPGILQNKALLRGIDMDTLAISIINLHKTYRNRIETFIGTKPNLSDFQSLILTAVAALIPYHQCMTQNTMNRIIVQSLRPGLLSHDPHVCVHAFTIMLLEVLEIMLRHLPEILLEMSKMSTTLNVAVPVLEFLSTLNRVPSNRFDNFVEVQYRYVFAIALPYTNPHKYNHYTVSLAHHVIAGWYLKCKLPLRRNFVEYILKGFKTNVQKPFEETKRSGEFVNEDSSNRQRSSSLTERGPKNRDRPTTSNLNIRNNEKSDEMVYNFHMELAETCIDFLQRNCYSTCSALPKRLPTTDVLLKGAQKKSWLIGHNIVTISTSGCSSVSSKNGLCEHCALLCKASDSLNDNVFVPPNGSSSPEVKLNNDGSAPDLSLHKRYTKASLLHNSSSESTDPRSTHSGVLPRDRANSRDPENPTDSTTAGTSSSSSSMEALSRRGSHPDTIGGGDDNGSGDVSSGIAVLRRESPGITSNNEPQTFAKRDSLHLSQQSIEKSKQPCICLCSGWAEILIRQPTGNISWMMRTQNQMSIDANSEIPLQNLFSLLIPSLSAVYPKISTSIEILQNHRETIAEPIPTSTTSNVTKTNEAAVVAKKRAVVVDAGEIGNDDDSPATLQKPQSNSTQTSRESVRDIGDDSESTLAPASDLAQNAANVIVTGDDRTTTTFPIDIPKSAHAYKIPSGSYSDVEPEMDDDEGADVAFEENDSRSRNPVRRVNSSPEMSSNYRHPFVIQKTSTATQPTTNTSGMNIANIHVTSSEDDSLAGGLDADQQQKKKNFSKERVNCEAIPEEITDLTPPNQQPIVIERHHSTEEKSKSSRSSSRGPSTDSLLPNAGSSTSPPRKQHSADDPLQQRNDQTGEETSIAASTASSSTRSLSTTLTASTQQQQQRYSFPEKPQGRNWRAMTMQSTTNPINRPLGRNNIAMAAAASSAAAMGVPLSPRLLAKAGGASLLVTGANVASDYARGRSKTISVPRERGNNETDDRMTRWTYKGNRAGISPSSVFLQLFNSGSMKGVERPIQIREDRVIKLLDVTPPFERHKIGVLYVGRDQCNNETDILRNRHGSLRYMEFLQNLGTLVSLKHAREMNIFIDMETEGRDGHFTYVWQDDIVQVTFHVATLMPTKPEDPNCTEKKKNIGNDYVSIVYNESGEEYDLNTIKGQFNYACIIVQPLELNSNRIFIKCKDEVSKFICHTEPKIISDNSAPRYARILALHANLASLVANSLATKNSKPYASNWLERLRRIKHERAKLMKESSNQSASTSSSAATSSSHSSDTQWLKEDFTKYTN